MASDWTTTAMAEDPFALFDAWFEEASSSEPEDPNAMALATVGADGRPSCRIVLLKAHDRRGFVFYTNTESRKGSELSAHDRAALLFHWKSLKRQIRIEGSVAPVDEAEADAYFASRGRRSRLGAHASLQSRPLPDRATLERKVDEVEHRFDGEDVPRPRHWSGYRVSPVAMEFWQDRPDRLHERLCFEPDAAAPDATFDDGPWHRFRLYP